MALAGKITIKTEVGNDYLLIGTLTLDASYPTGGWSVAGKLTETDTGAESVEWVRQLVAQIPGYLAVFDEPNQKLKLYRQTAATSALVEVPNATDLSAVTGCSYLAFAQ